MDRGYITVDAQYRTNVPGISAVGDVITFGTPGHPQLAHLSSAEGIVARRADRRPASSAPINYDHVPGCTYCDPEIGSVGLTEREAKRARLRRPRRHVHVRRPRPRARSPARSKGFVKIVADKSYDEVLGVHMIGPRSTELVAEATLALRLECDGRRADPHHPRASDDVRGGGRSGARDARAPPFTREMDSWPPTS